ncbi:hypothetical protein DL768_003193 [Monosporascus sp. mg162]|nr:hypothetical protein DL768_003193 [Monosporascus sp. mg162]
MASLKRGHPGSDDAHDCQPRTISAESLENRQESSADKTEAHPAATHEPVAGTSAQSTAVGTPGTEDLKRALLNAVYETLRNAIEFGASEQFYELAVNFFEALDSPSDHNHTVEEVRDLLKDVKSEEQDESERMKTAVEKAERELDDAKRALENGESHLAAQNQLLETAQYTLQEQEGRVQQANDQVFHAVWHVENLRADVRSAELNLATLRGQEAVMGPS